LLALFLLLVASALAPLAEASRTEVPGEDTVFTDISAALGVTADPAHGYLWFATEGGLVRTAPDLSTRTVYTTYHGLPGTLVHATRLVGDDLWVATAGGLARLHVPTGTITVHTMLTGALHDFLLTLDATPTDLWVGSDAGLLHYTLPGLKGTLYNETHGLLGRRVFAVAVDGPIVWAGTATGLTRLDSATGAVQTWRRGENGYPDAAVRNLLVDGDRVLLATGRGAYSLENGTLTRVPLEETGISTRDVQAVARIGEEIWWGTTQGIAIHREREDRWLRTGTREGLSDPQVTDIAAVNATHVAIATRTGLNVLDLTRVHYTVSRTGNGPWSNILITAATDGDTQWWGTGAGALRYTPGTGRFTHLTMADGLAGNWVYGIHVDEERWWFATTGGISWLTRDEGEWGFQSMNPSALGGEAARAIDGDAHEVWVGNAFLGVVRYNRTHDTWKGYGTGTEYPGDVRVNAVLVDYPHVWVGTESGVARFDRRTETWDLVQTDLVQGRVITTLAADGDRVYIGTREHGLVLWHRENASYESWSTENGKLLDDRLRTVAPEPGALWLGLVGGGALRLDLDTHAQRRYTTADGLLADYVTSFAFTPTTVYLGTLNGLSRIDRATDRVLPTHLGRGALLLDGTPAPLPAAPGTGGDGEGETGLRLPPSLSLETPAPGERLALPFVVSGSANAPEGTLTGVYVRVNGGSWTKADGLGNWSLTLQAGSLRTGENTLEAQALSSAGASPIAKRAFTVVDEKDLDPLVLRHAPPARGNALDATPLTFTATKSRANATLHYRHGTEGPFVPLAARVQGQQITVAVPAPRAAGPVQYYLTAEAHGQAARAPAEGVHQYVTREEARARVEPATTAAATLRPGEPTTVAFTVVNTGNVPLDLAFEIKGLPKGAVAAFPPTDRIPVNGTATVGLVLRAGATVEAARPVLKVLTSAGSPLAAVDFPVVPAASAVPTTAAPAPVESQGSAGIPAAGALLAVAAIGAAAILLVWRTRP
ncbi:MAG TPA: Ig-like domain-containing protein, partial [Candidatus Thermoplasmatota archaeon]|nr:Ig-like domain-containing protein [Candidatus Thermoplasmatota archaeon]